MNNLTIETEDTFASLLEFAANNDIDGFKQLIERDPSSVDEVGLWYGRRKGSKVMVLEHRTPLMVAATYGSADVLKLILSLPDVDVNRQCGEDKSTALHCAASSGSISAVEVVKALLASGADSSLVDGNGHRPVDVVVVSPKSEDMKLTLKQLLSTTGNCVDSIPRLSVATSNSNSPPLSSSPENGSPSSPSGLTFSPRSSKFNDLPSSERKEYPIDPSFPDIKNSVYATDEFRMYSFKVRPCSRAYSHDWTECPFVHPGENARRRDPRKFHYSCVPCPDFRKGTCRRADMCEYAHGVFECWLHPAQYRTRLCKDGTSCARRVCFFAHTPEELRPLYVSTGSAVPSPRSNSSAAAAAMDFAAAMNLLPGSPSSVSVMSPSPFASPMSPSASGISHSSMAWPQQNVPTLNLPGNNLQSSRLRSSFNARDLPAEEFNMLSDFDMQQQQILNDLSCLSQPCIGSNFLNRPGRLKTLTPSNLDDLFSSESSPRYSDQALAASVYSPTHKSALLNQFQQQQRMLSPINTNFSPKSVDHPLLQGNFGPPSSGRMSPRNVDPISPMSSRAFLFAQREKQQQLRSLSSRELGSHSSPIVGSPLSKWGSSNGMPDWAVSTDQLGRLRRSSSFEMGNNGEEPDLSWVQSLVKESPTDMKEKIAKGNAGVAASSSKGPEMSMESVDHTVLGAWLEQMQLDQQLQLDQLVAQ